MRSRRYRFTDMLLQAARLLLPAERRDWAQAMRAEAEHVSQDERMR
jgi:hypothetical protein